ncbi:type II toxin-antitoxin system VapC family toxin [Sphingomonas psychrolutea]|uniref:PIN domain-containing protein n=1 Tax=Sphingomonas psychrolutea TaxID=1259676 RepID=A0ABQ1GMJ6_9SPHN|nr:type II toxin-antitoxin system VapC family toxin [Sphingomonas psychrolutea]GGA46409.1 hypothetical protein GCM10011395_15830 [Sphingomonas psychrolutea]
MIVVDASLVVKWLVVEDQTEPAIAFLEAFSGRVCGPDILAIEVAGAIVRRVNDRSLSLPTGAAILTTWRTALEQNRVTTIRATPALIEQAGRLAIELGHPLADCLYLALAIELECELATCDAKFQAKASSAHPRVKLLSDFS